MGAKEQVKAKLDQVDQVLAALRDFIEKHPEESWDAEVLARVGLGSGLGHSKFDWAELGSEPLMFSVRTEKGRRSGKPGGPWTFRVDPTSKVIQTTKHAKGLLVESHSTPSKVSAMGRISVEDLFVAALIVAGNRKHAKTLPYFEDVRSHGLAVVKVEDWADQRGKKGHRAV